MSVVISPWFVAGFFAGTTIVLGIVLYCMLRHVPDLLDDVNWYQAIFLRLEGTVDGYGDYRLASIDGGANWSSVEDVAAGESVTTGPADSELLRQIPGLFELITYVHRNGIIYIPCDVKGMAMLKAAGVRLGGVATLKDMVFKTRGSLL